MRVCFLSVCIAVLSMANSLVGGGSCKDKKRGACIYMTGELMAIQPLMERRRRRNLRRCHHARSSRSFVRLP